MDKIPKKLTKSRDRKGKIKRGRQGAQNHARGNERTGKLSSKGKEEEEKTVG